MNRLHIAVDAHNLLRDRRGIGVYLREILRRWTTRDDVLLTLLLNEAFPKKKTIALTREIGGTFTVARRVPRTTDVSWHPWNGTFFSSGLVPAVATIHDVTPFAYPAEHRRQRRREQEPFVRSAGAARVLTDSTFSKREIVMRLEVPHERVRVIPLAADARFTPGEATLLPESLRERTYVLAVAADDARKNLATLVSAHARAFPNGEVALAVVGSSEAAGIVGVHDVRLDVLRDLYRGAVAFAMPSVYEGFGIPPLEAMRCGTPVVVSRAASLPEVCGEAALYVDAPLDAGAWEGALRRIVADAPLRASLRAQGAVQSARFSWSRTADATLAALREVVSS